MLQRHGRITFDYIRDIIRSHPFDHFRVRRFLPDIIQELTNIPVDLPLFRRESFRRTAVQCLGHSNPTGGIGNGCVNIPNHVVRHTLL